MSEHAQGFTLANARMFGACAHSRLVSRDQCTVAQRFARIVLLWTRPITCITAG